MIKSNEGIVLTHFFHLNELNFKANLIFLSNIKCAIFTAQGENIIEKKT